MFLNIITKGAWATFLKRVQNGNQTPEFYSPTECGSHTTKVAAQPVLELGREPKLVFMEVLAVSARDIPLRWVMLLGNLYEFPTVMESFLLPNESKEVAERELE